MNESCVITCIMSDSEFKVQSPYIESGGHYTHGFYGTKRWVAAMAIISCMQ